MKRARSNAEWLGDLGEGGEAQQTALEDLRGYLLRALPGALRSHGQSGDPFIEDVVQQALMRALQHLSEFEGRSRFTTWVTTIAVRVAITELRRQRWNEVSLEALGPSDGPLVTLEVDGSMDPQREVEQRALVLAIQQLLEHELTDRQRTAILAELGGMPQEEIGRRLGITRNAVYKLGHDARKKLKRGLEKAGFDAAAIRSAFP